MTSTGRPPPGLRAVGSTAAYPSALPTQNG
jgi:hypothetical protein